jgi:hypothetical protein
MAVQQRTNAADQAAGWAAVGNTVGQALAGRPADNSAFDKMQASNQQMLQNYLQQKRAERDAQKSDLAEAKLVADAGKTTKKYVDTKLKDGVYAVDMNNPSDKVKIGELPATEGGSKGFQQSSYTDEQGRPLDYNPTIGEFRLAKLPDGVKPLRNTSNVLGAAVPGYGALPGTGEDGASPAFNLGQQNEIKTTAKDVANDPIVREIRDSESLLTNAGNLMKEVDAGNSGALGTLVTMYAGSFQKGVLTDPDIARSSGIPIEVWKQGEDAVNKQLGKLDETYQIESIRKMLAAQHMSNQKKLGALQAGYDARLKSKGMQVPSEQYMPPASTFVAAPAGQAPQQAAAAPAPVSKPVKSAAEIEAELKAHRAQKPLPH